MIKHIVFWRVADSSLAKQYCEGAENLLEQMRSEIKGLIHIELGVDLTRSDTSSDIALYSEFESWEALSDYDAHPIHEQFKKYLGPLRTERRAVDYEI